MSLHAQSSESRVIEGATDWSALAKERKRKSELLTRNLHKRLVVRSDAGAQFAHPIRCHGQLDEMVAALNHIGVIASAASARWDHIPDSGFEFETEFIDDHLLLPIGEDVDGEYLVEMCNALRQFK